ncbi:MAG: hypothetical protein KDB27_32380 [Planctomycetales bacterium]|nr:hypothetical protein [Planctomycetales bacterium]
MNSPNAWHQRGVLAILLTCCVLFPPALRGEPIPRNLQIVLNSTEPVQAKRDGRLPLFVLPISGSLRGVDDAATFEALTQLDARAIGYSVEWNHNDFDASAAEGLRIARIQRKLGQPVAVNANSCLYSFIDGSEKTLHVDANGVRFADSSLGGKLGCPFALEHRIPVIKERVERFLRAYKAAGIEIDFIFADWEIDGPIEWNDSWAAHKKCEVCKSKIAKLDDFREFQKELRSIRSEIQRVAFGDNVTRYFPGCLVGNYGTCPHNGRRYWYDYFEKEPAENIPVETDGRAKYREWVHEFESTGYTFSMPVVYTWYPIFHWYDFADADYRWFYNMLLVGSNAGRHTPANVPIIPFVHWHTTAPPKQVDQSVKQFGATTYQDLLWHLLLRGHDTFFLWCMPDELEEEIRLVHQVYAESLQFNSFIKRGIPISFDVPRQASSVVSGLRLGNRVLIRRSDFADAAAAPISVVLDDGNQVVAADAGMRVSSIEPRQNHDGFIHRGGKKLFPIGFYEMPESDADLKRMADAGVNLVTTGTKQSLDRAHAFGMSGWMPLPLQSGATDVLRKRVEEVGDHPALAVWEGPDEIIWTFTAYSFLKDRAGFTRDDWNAQKPIAVEYSEKEAAKIMPAMRNAIAMIRQIDQHNRPVWINEAVDSDARFARQYMPHIDITGADYYAVRSDGTDLASIGRATDRWNAIGQGNPVWMVLQGFSWHAAKATRTKLYPTFAQSRFMAYDAIVHGARGVLYWGSNTIDEPQFRTSLYALTSELSALQPFLTGERMDGVDANLIHDLFDKNGIGVRSLLLRHEEDFLLILVNEDDHHRLGVDVHGLDVLNGREMQLLYGNEKATIANGNLVTRMQPFEVKVFSTLKDAYETKWRDGREF